MIKLLLISCVLITGGCTTPNVQQDDNPTVVAGDKTKPWRPRKIKDVWHTDVPTVRINS